MNDVELLREAARLMRERAEAATAGPWIAHSDGLVWPGPAFPGDPVSGSVQIEDAEHIASWHPLVALAVAGWLDAAAQREQYYRETHPVTCADPGEGDEVHGALIVARAYLGGAR